MREPDAKTYFIAFGVTVSLVMTLVSLKFAMDGEKERAAAGVQALAGLVGAGWALGAAVLAFGALRTQTDLLRQQIAHSALDRLEPMKIAVAKEIQLASRLSNFMGRLQFDFHRSREDIEKRLPNNLSRAAELITELNEIKNTAYADQEHVNAHHSAKMSMFALEMFIRDYSIKFKSLKTKEAQPSKRTDAVEFLRVSVEDARKNVYENSSTALQLSEKWAAECRVTQSRLIASAARHRSIANV